MKRPWLRPAFLALLACGLVFLARGRPRELPLDVEVRPQGSPQPRSFDLVVRRAGGALLRVEQSFDAVGPPAVVRVSVRAQPGPAEFDLTVVDAQGSARRFRGLVDLAEDAPARVAAEGTTRPAPGPGDPRAPAAPAR